MFSEIGDSPASNRKHMNDENTDAKTVSARARFLQVLREQEAIYLLINSLTVENERRIAQTRELAMSANKKGIRQALKNARGYLTKLRREYGVKVSGTELVELAEAIKANLTETDVLVPKFYLKEIFSHYGRALPEFDALPEHAHIAIRVAASIVPGEFGYKILEGVLFEDLAALFNSARRIHVALDRKSNSKEVIKTYEALCRASVTTACNFVEAYLNGIAFDHYIANEKGLDKKTIETLLDWNFDRNCTKYVTFRNKALQYPKIVLGRADPPLNESNCPELAFICGRAKEIRDAITHPAPRRKSQSIGSDKQQEVFRTDFAETERAVDSAVRLVRKIEAAIVGDDHRLFWLHDRDPEGFFPENTFE